MKKVYEIKEQNKWKTIQVLFTTAKNHKEAIESMDKNVKRIYNKRFREIEQTGHFYYVDEYSSKNGKCFIFECNK